MPGGGGRNKAANININAELLEMIDEAPMKHRLSLNLDVGDHMNGGSRLSVSGIELELTNDNVVLGEGGTQHPSMPGDPKLSSGVRSLISTQPGTFIDMSGTQRVDLGGIGETHSCWEMTWSEFAPSGSLMMAFDCPKDYQRNDAVLPKGPLYVSFSVWSKIGLLIARKYQANAAKQAQEILQERKEEFQKLQSANIMMKPIHAKNMEKLEDAINQLMPLLSEVPPEDSQVIELCDGKLFLGKRGMVFTKPEKNIGKGAFKRLGFAQCEEKEVEKRS